MAVAQDLQTLINIVRTSQQKSWPKYNARGEELLNLFGQLVNELSEEEQGLIQVLLEDFIIVDTGRYVPEMKRILADVPLTTTAGFTDLLAFPLLSPKDYDRGEIKSGHAVLYGLKDNLKGITPFDHLQSFMAFNVWNAPAAKWKPNTVVLFVDDFIGSGQTARKALKHYFTEHHIPGNKVIVSSLFVQQDGLDVLAKFDVDVHYGTLLTKGISDNPKVLDKAQATDLMRAIEARLSFPHYYRQGYRGSEALITLSRTPNNTFPVFWCEWKKYRRQTWPALFPREQS